MLTKVFSAIAAAGAAIVALYGGWTWGAAQIVWAADFKAAQQQTNCRFDRLERVNLEGQAADTRFRISQYSQKKLLTPEEARDVATLNTRLDALNRQLAELGVDCNGARKTPR